MIVAVRAARGIALVLLLVRGAGPARASEAREAQARDLYQAGRAAFQSERYPEALDRFREAYRLSHAPELLYNMASALEAMGRPGEAAVSLRAYLRAVEDPERDRIAARARALDEAQRILEAERLKAEPPGLRELGHAPPHWSRRRIALTAAGVTLGVVAGLAVGLGLGLGLRPDYPASTLGTQRVAP